MSETKRCTKCGETKPLNEFGPDPRMTLGRRSSCKRCAYLKVLDWKRRNPEKLAGQIARRPPRDMEKARAAAKRYYHRNKEARIDQQRKDKLGAPLGLYARLLAEQGGLCAICGSPPAGRAHSLDHCHVTGKMRGVLCTQCNRALGYFHDDPAIVSKAVAYLLKYS